jgi:cold shock CspA family protein
VEDRLVETPPIGTLVMDEIVDRDVVGSYTGQVKWFSDRLGFGFTTVCVGPEKGKDIFVHHTGIRPSNSNYRTLRKGEYVNFNLTNGHNGPQAVDVTGIGGGSLMCDVAPVRRQFVVNVRRAGEQPFFQAN